MAKVIKKKIWLYCLLGLSLFQGQAYAITAFIVKIQDINFMNVLFVPGSCNIHVDTNVLSGGICAEGTGGTGDVGHYRITADPGKTISILVSSKTDSGDGVIVTPSGKIKTDSAADVPFTADVTVNVNSGVSGEVNIYIAGTLTLTADKGFSTVYSVDFDIEFIEL